MLWLGGVLERYGKSKIREYVRTGRKGHWWTVSMSTEGALPFIKSVYGSGGLVMTRKYNLVKRFL